MFKESYCTSERIPLSGVYRVSHSAHRLPQEVTLLQGQSFPRCEKCDELVTFELLRKLPHLNPDAGFAVILFALPATEEAEEKDAA